MLIKGIQEEDFTNYKKASMFIIFPHCTFKCEKDCGIKCCQNSSLAKMPVKEVNIDSIVAHYINNPITHAIVCGGLEPIDSWDDLLDLITKLRNKTEDDIVIYTGYYPNEILDKINVLKQFKNIIIKFGRFIPNKDSHIDKVLGVELMNPEQYAEKIS